MIRIGIVNDMRLAIESLKRAVATLPGATVAWVAENGVEAVAKCAQDTPDVVLMDMIMPVMDGVEATRRIMKATPCPILVVTATVEGNASKVFEALGAGALDAVATPSIGPDGSSVNSGALVSKIKAIGLLSGGSRTSVQQPVAPPSPPASAHAIPPFIAVGSSTGGPQALATVLQGLPRPLPCPLVIVQHIDPTFAPGLAEWLSTETRQRVSVAQPGEMLAPGRIMLASSTDHLVIDGGGRLRYTPEPREMVYRPSVDVFYDSIVKAKAAPGIAVLLTGMGRDGAVGMTRLKAAGWHTIAQDKATSVVWGMPGAAVELNAAKEVLPIGEVGSAVSAKLRSVLEKKRVMP